MRIIPAIDIIDGNCVRLTKGDYNQKKIYNEDPLEVAKMFEAHGIKYLHLVDLDGAKGQGIINYRILEQIATRTSLTIDFGGGIKNDEDVRIAFNSGAAQLTAGSIAVKDQEKFLGWLNHYGSGKIILGADARDGMIATGGWLESSELDVLSFIKEYLEKGVSYVICTDISKDGMLQGASDELYADILSKTPEIKLIASGGISKMQDVRDVGKLGCEGVIIGKAIYENKISLKELEKFQLNAH